MPQESSSIIMSPPDYYDIEYVINPWMDLNNPVDPDKAQDQWQALNNSYKSLGYSIKIIPPKEGLPDLAFTTDHITKLNSHFIASRFFYKERQVEQAYIIPWYEKHGYQITQLPKDHYMEGGDILMHNGNVYIGYGFRTSQNTASFIRTLTEIPTTPLKLIDKHFYHLDTCLLPLDNNTAFYYPEAFDQQSRKILEENIDNLIPFTQKEVNHFAANSVLLGKTIIHQKGTDSFPDKLHKLGYKTIELDMSEYNKSGGGIHCLSQINDSSH